jgi:hypothetical protein
VYALIKVNHLIGELSPTKSILLPDKIPTCLKPYLDVFSINNAKKLAPYRDVDLTINL